MNREIHITKQFKKELEKASKNKMPISELFSVIEKLQKDEVLNAKHNDHALVGSMKGVRDCHIRPDWVLLYSKEDNGELHLLHLSRIGSHSQLNL